MAISTATETGWKNKTVVKKRSAFASEATSRRFSLGHGHDDVVSGTIDNNRAQSRFEIQRDYLLLLLPLLYTWSVYVFMGRPREAPQVSSSSERMTIIIIIQDGLVVRSHYNATGVRPRKWGETFKLLSLKKKIAALPTARLWYDNKLTAESDGCTGAATRHVYKKQKVDGAFVNNEAQPTHKQHTHTHIYIYITYT